MADFITIASNLPALRKYTDFSMTKALCHPLLCFGECIQREEAGIILDISDHYQSEIEGVFTDIKGGKYFVYQI